MLDGFLELLRGGKPAVHGENLDASFGAKHAMAILSFTFSSDSKSARALRDLFGDEETGGDSEQAMIALRARQASLNAGAPRPFSLNFEVTKYTDSATPALFVAYSARASDLAKPYDLAKVTLRKAGGAKPLDYLVLQFTEVYVASYDVDGGMGDKPPTETITFTFKTCSIMYRAQKTSGTAPARQTAWNFENPATT